MCINKQRQSVELSVSGMEQIDKLLIAQSFGQAAETYDAAAHFQQSVGRVALEKIPVLQPKLIMDLGCGTGFFTDVLQKKYQDSVVLGVDLSEKMLGYASIAHSGVSSWAVADAESLPFKESSVDLIFSSLAIQWCANLPSLMNEIKRVLKPEGVFVFSTLLEGSLVELKRSWQRVDDKQHVNDFFRQNDYFDAAINAGLVAEKMEQVTQVLQYKKLPELMRELKELGAHNINQDRSTSLTGRRRLSAVIYAYEDFRDVEGMLPVSYEVLYGVLRNT